MRAIQDAGPAALLAICGSPIAPKVAEAASRGVMALVLAGIAATTWKVLHGTWPFEGSGEPAWVDELPPRPGPGDIVPPPWQVFPHNEPWSLRQGSQEAWLVSFFLPYWRALGPAEREAYLERNPPPDEDWNLYLHEIWA